MRQFADFSRRWGIGKETFEYWSWMARQWDVPLVSAVSPGGAPLDMDAIRTLGLNLSHALQHPGHYYYMAARCMEARRERFLACESTPQGASMTPGYADEKKVDHLTIVLEV